MIVDILLAVLIGLLVGGVLNVLADDLPRYRAPRMPRYPDDTPRPPLAWLGITAFLFGKRAASLDSRRKLSWRYPLTEIATAALMVLAVVVSNSHDRMSDLRLLFWLVYMAFFVLITVIDVEHRLILFTCVIPFGIVAFVDALVEPAGGPDWQNSLLGGLLGFGVFFLLYLGGFLFVYLSNQMRQRQLNTVAFGYGDVMLITVSGLMLGWEQLILAMFITVFLGAAGGLVWLIGRSVIARAYSWYTPLPYGPYIVIATIIMLLFGTQVAAVFL
jgi:prepilin signal peptidase PulO-like enzyme (type II secretory pathway)